MARMTRRELLRAAGAGTAFALPLLASLGQRKAMAGAPSYPRRAIFLYMPQNETEDFTPSMAGGTLSFTGTYLAPLAAYAAKALHISNLTGTSGHEGGHTEWLTGWPSSNGSFAPAQGPSLDQYVAGRLGNATRLPTLGLTLAPSYMLGNTQEVVSWTSKALPVPSFGSAHQAFAQVFAGVAGSTQKTNGQAPLAKGVLDALVAEYGRVNATLGASDRILLDAHLTQLRQLETRLGSTPAPGAACTPPANPPESGNMYYPDLRALARDHIDVLVAALQCDITRVATLAFGASGTEGPFDWAPVNVQFFHEVAHRDRSATSDPRGDFFRVRTWHAQQVAYLLQKLDAISEGDGTLLDHTLVAWLPELGYYPTTDGGGSPNTHLRDQVSVLLFGGSGAFKLGRMVNAGQSHYHNLLLTMGQALGYPDLTSFGAQGKQPLTAILS